jgi:Sigma-70 region 2
MLTLLLYALHRVDQTGYLEVEVPASLFSGPSWLRVAPLAPRHAVRHLPPERQRLLALLKESAVELHRLSLLNTQEKVLRKLGYALHVVPGLVRRGGFEAERFRFNFRVAEYAWSEISVEMRRILCELAGTSIDRVEQLMNIDRFTVKIYADAIPSSSVTVDDFHEIAAGRPLAQPQPPPTQTPVSPRNVGRRFLDRLDPHLIAAFQLASGKLNDKERAEDAVQAAVFKAARWRDESPEDSAFGPWFLGIVANECRRAARKSPRSRPQP